MKLPNLRRRRSWFLLGIPVAAAAVGSAHFAQATVSRGQVQLPTDVRDFMQPGTQPEPDEKVFAPVLAAQANCIFCHAEYLQDPERADEPYDGWVNSMMGQAARDPVWRAALHIANNDANEAGEYCIRCHAPGAWLGGRSMPPDGSAFIDDYQTNDFEGIQCHFCHRSVNPVFEKDSPDEDFDILAALEFPPGDQRGNGRYVVDPSDVRRGPYQDIAENEDMNPHGVPVLYSPWHSRSEMCGTCHDVGNPVFSKDKDGRWVPNGWQTEHPTQDPYDMFPEQRTYSEWRSSAFAMGGVLFGDGRFGGNHPTGIMESCQDCHMPDQVSGGCSLWENPPWYERQDLPQHTFAGANHWVLRAILDLNPYGEAGIDEETVADAEARAVSMLQAASDLQAVQIGDRLQMRVINFSGHKLPTGYPEGRRMWLNIRYLDDFGQTVAQRGAYDFATGDLTESDTKVYRAKVGIGEDVAALTGLDAGPSNHLTLVNEILLDNRIPPIGFTNAAFETFDGQPVAYTYEDGQYWDDTLDPIPNGAVEAVVTLYYQAMTREYIEFLQEKGGADGQLVYDLWADPLVGNKAAPVDMDTIVVPIVAPVVGDADHDGMVGFGDILAVLAAWGPCPPPDLCAEGDTNGDNVVDFQDILNVLGNWGM